MTVSDKASSTPTHSKSYVPTSPSVANPLNVPFGNAYLTKKGSSLVPAIRKNTVKGYPSGSIKYKVLL
jgi:hypothetical protein